MPHHGGAGGRHPAQGVGELGHVGDPVLATGALPADREDVLEQIKRLASQARCVRGREEAVSRKHPEGVVLALAAPHPDARRAAAGEQVTVYWEARPDTPNRWAELQRDAARFVDEALALHTLRALSPGALERSKVWVEPALHQRNGGPVTPVITAPPAGTGEPERPEVAPEPEPGDLFGSLP